MSGDDVQRRGKGPPTTPGDVDQEALDERRKALGRLLSGPPMPVVDDWMEMKRIAREGYYDE